jgi:uncharacterized repeat protein (TIGR03803 family)
MAVMNRSRLDARSNLRGFLAIALLTLASRYGEATGATLTNLYIFAGSTNGIYPRATLVQGSDGYFYGTTSGGGQGEGTVFKISSTGSLMTLHSFCDPFFCFPNVEGENPYSGLTQGTDGYFYGTTTGGGTNQPATGTIFKITSEGTLTTLYHFGGAPGGGAPYAGLVQGTDGYFYGTTSRGGTSTNCGMVGCGTVYKMNSAGSLTIIHSFSSTDGSSPRAALVQGTDGFFYGTTSDEDSGDRTGTVFKVSSTGSTGSVWKVQQIEGSW